MAEFKILFIADLCGKAGRQAASYMTRVLKEKFKADYIITNVENAAGGFGVTPEMSKKIYGYGTDIQTSGNHIWDRQDIINYLYTNPKLLRPANFPDKTPGLGYYIDNIDDIKIGVVNLMGRTYMKDIDCPFKTAENIIDEIRKQTNLIFIDFHAEATSEKQALLYHLDGRVTAIVGTHTHVQTADERVTKEGTAFICDAGMTGSYDSVIGMNIEPSVKRFLTGMPIRFTPGTENVKISGVLIKADTVSGKAKSIERYVEDFDINNVPKLEKDDTDYGNAGL